MDEHMKQLPTCPYRYSPIGYELCDYGNESTPAHRKHIASCCANVCPLNKFPDSEKMSFVQMYCRDMKKIDRVCKAVSA